MTKITQSVDLGTRGRVAVFTVDNPPVNALSQHVRKGLHDGIKQAIGDRAVQAIVIVCSGRTFIAGADITEFGKPPMEPGLHSVLDLIESSPKPVVSAIHGTALGGGLEVTLACHYRVGAKGARFGLPEVKLGILPGAGGTQRLPRVVGPQKALQMIVSGDPIGADEALKVGLIDEIVDGDLTAAGVAFAEKALNEKRPLRKIRDLDDKIAPARGKPEIFAEFRKSVARQTRGFRAPENCIKAVEAAVNLPFAEGIRRERELFVELLNSPESKAQRYFFFAEREAAKIPDVAADTPTKEIKKAAVIGAGTMGGGIAMNFANAGIPVTVVEVAQEALDRGLGIVRKNYEATASRGRLTPADVEKRMGLITGSVDFKAAADADIVIEAVFEEMPIKKEVFAKLDAICKPDAVLATNTSTLDVDEIASATKRPESVIGTHFFSPANVMRLLENVRGKKSSKTTVATAMAVGSARCRSSSASATVSSATACCTSAACRPRSSSSRGPRPTRWIACSPTSASRWARLRWATWPASTWAGASERGAGRKRRSPIASASLVDTDRRPVPATSSTRRAIGRRSPTRRSRKSSSTSPRPWGSPGDPSATTKSSRDCSTRWSTRAPRSSRRRSRSARATST